jgi:hypothetical protein
VHARPGHEELEKRHGFTAMNEAEKIAFIQLNRAIILENLRFPDRNYEFATIEKERQLDADRVEKIPFNLLQVNGEDQGCVIMKDIQMRALDYIADRPRMFFENLNGVITLEDFMASEPKDLRGHIFDVQMPDLDDQAE